MQFCRYCIMKLVGVLSFSKDKYKKFCRCPKSHSETRHNKIKDNDLNFREVLDKEIRKRK